jgi:trigger factor
MNDKVGQAFQQAASEAKLRVAGAPKITEKEGAAEGQIAFDATFEVYPEVKLGDLSATEVEKVSADVTEAAIDKTLDILRKQRRTFAQRPAAEGAQEGDRVTIDFEGKIDGVPFQGGKAENFQFMIGEGQMLETFDKAVRGMKAGESKTFPLQFPADYHGKDVAGKEADFLVTVKKIEQQNLPEVNEAFAKSLGIKDGTAGPQQGGGDGCPGQGGRARRAEVAGGRRDGAHDRERPRRPEEAWHQGRRDRADPCRDLPAAGREACASRAGGRRAGPGEQPPGPS